ncbi:MAG: SDR family NAD(P)-dependent oxidoreductase [bacterium]|nr:SDR family NAD(P)-dependent oxidoreductase [bacterium]
MRLQGKIALVTGAARGIGRGIAEAFAREGAAVGVLDLHAATCDDVVQAIYSAGGLAVALPADVTDEHSINHALDGLRAAFGDPEILVNNAAVMPSGRLHETDPADADHILAVNLRGAYLVSRAVIPAMLAARKGSIIHMASVTGILGLPGIALYSATKGGLIALARAMSTDYARDGIRVNSVSPGTIDSPMLHQFLNEQRPESRERLRSEFDSMHPLGRVGTIAEVAQVCVFLASDDASFVTGANYTVDGGLSVKGTQPQD